MELFVISILSILSTVLIGLLNYRHQEHTANRNALAFNDLEVRLLAQNNALLQRLGVPVAAFQPKDPPVPRVEKEIPRGYIKDEEGQMWREVGVLTQE